jgi:single-strand DNA-binding protein
MYQQVTIVGNLGGDPEMRYTQGGDPVTSFKVATSKHWTGKDGQKQEKVVWFRVSVWGAQAEPCSTYLAKGRQVMVVGEVEEPRVFTDKAGNTRAALEIRASQVKFLGQRGDGAGDQAPKAQTAHVATKPGDSEEIPF